MNISDQRIQESIQVYKEEFGEDISISKAREMITRFMALYDLLARPLPDEPRQHNAGDFGDIRDIV